MSTLEGYLYLKLPPVEPTEDDSAPAPPPKPDEVNITHLSNCPQLPGPFALTLPPSHCAQEIYESHHGDRYIRKYVSLDIYVGMKLRNHQPSFLSGDDEEDSGSDRDLDPDDPANDPNSIMYKPRDKWHYLFGGDVSLTKMEPKSHIKAKVRLRRLGEEAFSSVCLAASEAVNILPYSFVALLISPRSQEAAAKGKSKSHSHKKFYPLMLLTKVDPIQSEKHDGQVLQSSWVTVAAESKEEMHKWIQMLRKARDLTQYMRACRDCNQATPLKVVVNACSTGDWKSLNFENVRLTNSSICALAVFFKRQVNSAKAKTKSTTGERMKNGQELSEHREYKDLPELLLINDERNPPPPPPPPSPFACRRNYHQQLRPVRRLLPGSSKHIRNYSLLGSDSHAKQRNWRQGSSIPYRFARPPVELH